ncbi:MAG: hypothetical protein GF317_23380 [Candidatus Lokiarchaeota archaeon]|nr:hypothetical protein [Candidatus Lokiarchaeota archaeon]
MKTFIIEEKESGLIVHNPTDLLQWKNYGTTRTAEYLATVMPNFHVVDIEIPEGKKVLKFIKKGEIFDPVFYPDDWKFTDNYSNVIRLNPEKWQYRIRVTDEVIRDDSALMAVLKSIVTSKNLPRWEYETDRVEAYFRIIKQSDITAIENVKTLKGWTDNDFLIQKFDEL